jgi:hypothetical protein
MMTRREEEKIENRMTMMMTATTKREERERECGESGELLSKRRNVKGSGAVSRRKKSEQKSVYLTSCIFSMTMR